MCSMASLNLTGYLAQTCYQAFQTLYISPNILQLTRHIFSLENTLHINPGPIEWKLEQPTIRENMRQVSNLVPTIVAMGCTRCNFSPNLSKIGAFGLPKTPLARHMAGLATKPWWVMNMCLMASRYLTRRLAQTSYLMCSSHLKLCPVSLKGAQPAHQLATSDQIKLYAHEMSTAARPWTVCAIQITI